ncbi:MAG: hypothetical protein HYR55_17300 [Acidobacteria bacterium]|nr:hypothetical protein [Acidobacteriota bacterium]
MSNTRASLRSENCPIWIGIPVRLFSESVSAFVGIRTKPAKFLNGHKEAQEATKRLILFVPLRAFLWLDPFPFQFGCGCAALCPSVVSRSSTAEFKINRSVLTLALLKSTYTRLPALQMVLLAAAITFAALTGVNAQPTVTTSGTEDSQKLDRPNYRAYASKFGK